MEIKKITDPAFRKYGKILTGIDFTGLVEEMQKTPCPDNVIYEPSIAELEALPVYGELQRVCYGELPIQVGYCNGYNKKLNAVEYHRSSELDIAASDAILLLGWQPDVTEDYTYETAKIEAFLLPKGVGVELYATTLHYAPCGVDKKGFRCVVVLPKGTNYPIEQPHLLKEDKLLAASNKWLLAHEEAKIAGAFNGLKGENISIGNL